MPFLPSILRPSISLPLLSLLSLSLLLLLLLLVPPLRRVASFLEFSLRRCCLCCCRCCRCWRRSSAIVARTCSRMARGTRTHANTRSCVTQPPFMSHARMSRYASRWSLLGMSVLKARGWPDSSASILGSDGSDGKRAAYATAAVGSSRRSAFGDTMYVSRWCSGGMARARRQ